MLVAIIYFLYLVRIVLLPFVLAIFIVYLVNPFVKLLINRGVSRNLALVLIFIIVVGGLFLVGFFAAPPLIEELNALANRIPQYSIEIQKIIDSVTQKYQRFKLPSTFQLVVDNAIERIQNIILQFVERTTEVIIGILSRFFSLIMAPILAFYMLKDIETIKKNFWTLIPKESRKDIKQLLKKIDKVLIDYLKGQLLVSVVVGLLSMLGLYLLDINFYLIIGIFAGIMNLIPYLGVVFGILPAVFVASFKSFQSILEVIVMFAFVQQLEGSLISPKIVGDKVGLHPILIIFSLLVGGELLGIIGMLLAVPVAGIIKVILNHYISRAIKINKGES
ncbi:AI-2E family transporter [Acetohalobium arabaticum]|uniref:AI-2E family transporter n=1 Tax=Acetohalobium arabaticum TaxID=28187 RepID=UPI00247B0409|nr:AI-2E family transporter [Acetohalobium arabaticum]